MTDMLLRINQQQCTHRRDRPWALGLFVFLLIPRATHAWGPVREKPLLSLSSCSRHWMLSCRGGGSTASPAVATSLIASAIQANPSDKPQEQASPAAKPNNPEHHPIPNENKVSPSTELTTKDENNHQVSPPQQEEDDPQILFLIRILFLSYYSSLGALLPYLPVYYHSLGHGGQIIGMLGAVKPLTTFIVAPFWGLVADQTQAPFAILKVTFLVSLVGQLLVAASHDYRYIMIMVFLTALFNAPVKSLIDSMVMDHIHDQSRYGRLRLWGQMGFGLGSSGVGVLLSRSKGVISSTATSIPASWTESIAKLPMAVQKFISVADKFWQAITGYRLLFLTHAALSIPTWLAILKFQQLDKDAKVEKQQQQKQLDKPKNGSEGGKGGALIQEGLNLLVHNGDALFFFFLIFVVGVSSGVIENFAYVRIREVGGSGKDMGLSRLVSSIAGAPMFWFSGSLTQKLGADRVLVASLLSYVVRFAIYASMRHPLHGLPAEALRGITFAAFWSTGTIYAHRISPPGLHATMLMFLNAMYGGLGQSLGAIIGGKLQSKVGTVWTFLYAAGVDLCFVGLVLFYLSVKTDSNFRNPTPIVRTGKTTSA
ncbi:Major facilitator superfamily domain-containing protein 6 [Seminavis robusta]|uniref:Major facilitator superfamily domain-containing protein 6 n=1 Tax=Seminavis robusta TaxID=568900 RepID=A0A9N8DZD9_9STRA|nr:Major facilitator superfamily domain-containing protein 6 [Seminavis robusta]|eukprot:Sro388_g132420.1 Major facilitator superfamily domain-containing protein 6 (597) ;mRNA; r:53927-55853